MDGPRLASLEPGFNQATQAKHCETPGFIQDLITHIAR